MKHLTAALLCCLLLCGCGATPAQTETTQATTPTTTAAAEPAGCYIPGSDLEQCYHGAVRRYEPELPALKGLLAFGDGLLLLSGEDTTTLTLLTGDQLFPAASLGLDFLLSPEDPSLVIREDTLSFYDPAHRETVVLDTRLRTVRRIDAPEGLSGVPILSRDRSKLYYCTETALMEWDLEADLHRMRKEMAYPGQRVTGLLWEDTVIQCTTEEETLFLSAATGSLLTSRRDPIRLLSQGRSFLASFHLGLNPVVVYGTETDTSLLLPEALGGSYFLLGSHPGTVRVLSRGEETRLEYYDLETGLRRSVLSLPIEEQPSAMAYLDVSIYLLCPDTGTILRWDTAALAANDAASHAVPFATDSRPQADAMARCEAYAKELSQRFGIQIRIGTDAAGTQPWDYDLAPETQPALLMRELTLLEQRLSRFPEGMLADTAADFSGLNLCLVRSVTGSAESGSLNAATGVQFLDGTESYVAIAAGQYAEQALYHELFHAMETHIFNNSIAFDQWETLNPSGFAYAYGYAANEQRDSGIYLQKEYRAFVDAYSMSFPKEDRARIFEYAMLEGMEDLFQFPALQAKLQAVCAGLREAYGLKTHPEPLPWEQYLD